MRLTDFIVTAVEASMLQKVVVPEGVSFADLHLSRGPDGVSFDWAPIEGVCEASGIDSAVYRDAPEGAVTGLLVAWYHQHLAHGGAHDAVADDLIAEVRAEDAAGQPYSHKPGRA